MKKSEQPESLAKVKRENGKVWVEGVPSLGFGRGRDCTFAGALEAALAVTEHPYTYSDIMGLSGLAFRVRWYQGDTGQRWCPSSPVGEFPGEIAAVQKATGWQLHVESRMGQENPEMERSAPEIVASIDAGRPVLGYEPRLNMDVIYGYEDGGKTLLLRDYFQGEPLRLPASKLGPMLIFLRGYTEPLPRRIALKEALSIAVRNWRRESLPSSKGKYLYGDAAFAAWIQGLGQVDRLAEEEQGQLFLVSWWNFESMCDARHAAVSFLHEGAAILEGGGQEAVKHAAALYQQEVEILDPAFNRKDAFLGPWSGKSVKDWSADVQRREREVLTEARKAETAAVSEIEKALAALAK